MPQTSFKKGFINHEKQFFHSKHGNNSNLSKHIYHLIDLKIILRIMKMLKNVAENSLAGNSLTSFLTLNINSFDDNWLLKKIFRFSKYM